MHTLRHQFSAFSGTPGVSLCIETLSDKTKPTDFPEAHPGQHQLMHDFKWFYLGCSNKPKGTDEGVTTETWRKLISTKELHTAQNLNMRETMEMTHPRQPGR